MVILVWKWDDAPEEYKFSHGGDEDWVVYVPEPLDDEYIEWLDHIGCCHVSEHKLEHGTVYVGSHS